MSKNKSQKFLEKTHGLREIGCLFLEGISLKLKTDTWEFPRCIRVVENDKLLAKIKIPQSTPHDVEIIEGSLTPEQVRDTLTILNDHEFGVTGWESIKLCLE